MTEAHDQSMTLHILAHVPEHAPREDDPHYRLFEQMKSRMKRLGLLKCVIGDDLCSGPVEIHHSAVEFSQINATDPDKIAKAYGLHFETDEEFQAWCEGPSNAEPLCVAHHRTHFGIHVLPEPLWQAVRFKKAGAPAPAEFIATKDLPK
jgi:hypothetical protein